MSSAKPSPIRPLADRVVAIRETAQEKTSSGLYLPETAKEKPVVAKVVALGKDVKQVSVGDRIIYKDYTVTELRIDNIEYLIVKEDDILGVM